MWLATALENLILATTVVCETWLKKSFLGNTCVDYCTDSVQIVKNVSHDSSDKRTSSDLLVDKTYWIVAFRMSVLVSILDAGSPKKESKLNRFLLVIYD